MSILTLHIGIHRTGTTGVQRNLSANRERLEAQGISYPFGENNHQKMVWAIHRGDLGGAEILQRLKPLENFSQIILSGEDFCIHKSLDWLAEIKAHYDVRAVIYLRRQDHWLMSWYNQHLKWPFSRRHSTMTPGEFLACVDEFYWIDFKRTTDMWEAALGKDNVHVRLVEKGQVENVVSDFLQLTGVDVSLLKLDNVQHNDSLPVETLEFARRAGLIDLRPPKRMAILNFLREVVASPEHSGRTLFTASDREALLQRFDAGNRAVAQHFFGRDTLFFEGSPTDAVLYSEGELAEHVGFEEIVMKALKYLGADH